MVEQRDINALKGDLVNLMCSRHSAARRKIQIFACFRVITSTNLDSHSFPLSFSGFVLC